MSNCKSINEELDNYGLNASFDGNESLKPAKHFEPISMESATLAAEELIKCSDDIEYFAKNYFTIISLDRGEEIIRPYEKQKELLQILSNDNIKRVLVLSSRQSGKCQNYNSIITIRNKKTQEIEKISIKDFMIKLNLKN